MKGTLKSGFQFIKVAAIVFIFLYGGQAFGAQSITKPAQMPTGKSLKSFKAGTFTGKPDLKVIMVDINPKTPAVGSGTITIKVTVKNQGTAPTSAPCSLTMSVFSVDEAGNHISGNNLMAAIPGYTNNIPILGPGKKQEITKLINLHYPGRNQIEGVINTESLQPGEENGSNNYYKHHFTMKPKPAPADLVLHYIKATSDGRVKIKMSNDGKPIPTYNFNHAWVKATVAGSSMHGQLLLKDIDPNGTLKIGNPNKYVMFIWPDTGPQGIKLTSGNSYTVEVVLDCFPRINDADRSNNSKTVTLSP